MIGFDWNGWTRHPEGAYTCVDPGLVAMECEYLELVWGLIRATQPAHLLETGSGISTHLCRLAAVNGHLTSVDVDHRITPADRLTIVDGPALEFLATYDGPPFDFALLDSSEESKPQELALLLAGRLAPTGLVVVHDTGDKHTHLADFRLAIAEVCTRFGAARLNLAGSRGVTVIQP